MGIQNLFADACSDWGWNSELDLQTLNAAVELSGVYCLVETNRGYVGLVPEWTAVEDALCILKDCGVPVVLREVNDYFLFVGTAFSVGLMEGEAARFRSSQLSYKTFRIR